MVRKRLKKIKKPNFVWNWTRQKKDFLFVLLLSLALFLWDINMNKVVDKGIDYKVHLIESLQVPAITVMYIGGLGILLFLSLITIDAIGNRRGIMKYDYLVGAIGFLSFAFLMLGGILQILHIETFPFIAWEMYTITAYHILAIGGFIGVMIYFVITE